MSGKKQGRKGFSRKERRPGPASCLPFLNTGNERLFNLYAVCEDGYLSHMSVRHHGRLAASLERQFSFLGDNIEKDYSCAVRYKAGPECLPGSPGPWKRPARRRLTEKDYRNMIGRGDILKFLRNVFHDLNILEDSVFILTSVVDGCMDEERMYYT